MDRESVDLNSFLVFDRMCIDCLAEAVGEEVVFDLPGNAADRDGSLICNHFFDPEDGFFHDRLLGSSGFVKACGTEAAIPLWTGMASPEQAEAVISILTDGNKFGTFIPFPTLAADDPSFSPEGYWRGPIWLDQAYFCISGIRRYGHVELADRLTCDLFDRLQGLKDSAPIHENYNPLDGTPLEAPHFSWSAASILLLYEEYGKNF